MTRFVLPVVFCIIAADSATFTARPVPLRASVDTVVAPLGPCGQTCVGLNITGSGQAAHLGRITIAGPSTINLATGAQAGTSTLTAADGSELDITIAGTFTFTSQTDVAFSGSWTVVGGTGRFADSSGGGTYHGTASFLGSGELFMDGTVTDTGRN